MLSKMLREAREGAGLSKAKVAAACKVSHSAVWHWENDADPRTPSNALLGKYLGILGIHGSAQAPYYDAAGVSSDALVDHEPADEQGAA